MQKPHLIQLMPLIFMLAINCAPGTQKYDRQDGLATLNTDSLKEHIRILSSDDFEGRRPFTQGEEKTVNYLSQSFASMGLEPGNGSGYFQEVPMVEITTACDPLMTVQTSKGRFDLKNFDDYVVWTKHADSVVSLVKDDLIFAGYGIVAPEYRWNDYDGLDVKGKVVLVIVNDPGFGSGDSTLFKGNAMTYYGRWTYKFEEAARQGAKACLIIHNTKAASYPFQVVQNGNSGAKLHLDDRESRVYQCAVEGWVSGQTANKLLKAGGQDTTLLSLASKRGFKGVPLGIQLSTSMKGNAIFKKSKNVIGKITGATRPDEYIVYSAHWDHFGIAKPDERGDSIYNGALDNASGTAALLEVARAFKSMKNLPDRSILFLAVTGEEQGLLGSAYYAQHPLYPNERTVANINIDVINNFGRTRDIAIVGSGQSELEDYLRKEVESKGRYIAAESHPEAGHYFRSDHFNFAKAGVPALTTGSGIDHVDKGKEYGQMMEDKYTEKYYHRPADEYSETWNLEGGMDDIELLFQIGKRMAFETSWPQWKEGSEFKILRNK